MTTLPQALLERWSGIRSLGVVTGAGVSAESGVQTYRGQGGLYDDPETGDRTVAALTGEALARDPDHTWRVVADLARQSLAAEPNAGHYAIAKMERRVARFALLTQNVDGLHARAGSRNVIEIHGNLGRTVCTACGAAGRLDRSDYRTLERAPHCAECGGVLRPDVVLFGEMLPLAEVARMRAGFELHPPDAVVVAGTSALFPYIQAAVLHAHRAGKLTIEVNPEPTGLTAVVDWALRGPGGAYLPALADALPAPSSSDQS